MELLRGIKLCCHTCNPGSSCWHRSALSIVAAKDSSDRRFKLCSVIHMSDFPHTFPSWLVIYLESWLPLVMHLLHLISLSNTLSWHLSFPILIRAWDTSDMHFVVSDQLWDVVYKFHGCITLFLLHANKGWCKLQFPTKHLASCMSISVQKEIQTSCSGLLTSRKAFGFSL